MCGRFTNRLTWREIVELYRITEPTADRAPNLAPRYNVAPTQKVPIVCTASGGEHVLQIARWGLVPSWAKDVSIGNKLINARAEAVATKPAFRSAFRRRRCLVPADGFYEWAQRGKVKQPYHFSLQDGSGFAFAGLWELWPREGEEDLLSCTIVTTDANELVAQVHPRMPVILAASDYDAWMTAPAEEAEGLLKPYPTEEMVSTAVSTVVNKPANDGPECLVPVAAA